MHSEVNSNTLLFGLDTPDDFLEAHLNGEITLSNGVCMESEGRLLRFTIARNGDIYWCDMGRVSVK